MVGRFDGKCAPVANTGQGNHRAIALTERHWRRGSADQRHDGVRRDKIHGWRDCDA